MLSVRKRNKGGPHSRTPKRKDAPVPENKVVSLNERAKDEEKPFLEQLLQEGARKLGWPLARLPHRKWVDFVSPGRKTAIASDIWPLGI
jgi:hypothetical protein